MPDDMEPINRLICRLHPHRVHRSTVYRWCVTGIVSKLTGKRIKLRRKQIGGEWFARAADYHNFVEHLNGTTGE